MSTPNDSQRMKYMAFSLIAQKACPKLIMYVALSFQLLFLTMKPQGMGHVPECERYKPYGYLYADGLGLFPYYVVQLITTQHPGRRLTFLFSSGQKGTCNKM